MSALVVENVNLQAGSFCLRDLSFSIEESEYFVIMGMTGSGKSLLLKAVCGLAALTSGSIKICGRDVTDLAPRCRRIGYVAQDAGLFPHLNVLDNIIFPLMVRGVNKNSAVREVEDIVASLSIGHLLSRSVINLSGGERQKVALARALACKPQLLVFDEPVSALDEPSRYETCSELRKVQQQFKIATLHVCHSREEAKQLSDRIGVMCGGRLVASGTMTDLINKIQPEPVMKLFGRRA